MTGRRLPWSWVDRWPGTFGPLSQGLLKEISLARVGARRGQAGAWGGAPFAGGGGGEAAAPPTWVAEAKERMAEVAATEPQGSLRGIRSLESSGEAPEQRAMCVGGRIRGWAGGADGGRGEKIKGPVGPQTVTVVGLCPLPPPASLYSPGGPGGSWVGRGAVVRCCFHHSWLLFWAAVPPCVCVLPLRISSNRSLCRCLVCVTLGFACDGGLCAVQLLL